MTEGKELSRRPLGRSGLAVTTLGFGGGPVGWLDGAGTDARAEATLEAAWDAGIRYFDTAPYYGHGRSERRLGAFLRGKRRVDFVLSTKVGRLIRPSPDPGSPVVFDYGRDGTLRSVEESLERLGLDRIDILLIHDIDVWTHGREQPRRFEEAAEGAWRVLADMRREGLVRAVGLGVNEAKVCADFARRFDPDLFLLAGRSTLLDQSAAAELIPLCREKGIGIVVGGPFNSGILATGPVQGARYDYAPASEAILARVGRIAAVCAAHGVPLPAAALRYPLRSDVVAAVIPGADRPEDVAAIAGWAQHEIPPALWADLAAEGIAT